MRCLPGTATPGRHGICLRGQAPRTGEYLAPRPHRCAAIGPPSSSAVTTSIASSNRDGCWPSVRSQSLIDALIWAETRARCYPARQARHSSGLIRMSSIEPSSAWVKLSRGSAGPAESAVCYRPDGDKDETLGSNLDNDDVRKITVSVRSVMCFSGPKPRPADFGGGGSEGWRRSFSCRTRQVARTQGLRGILPPPDCCTVVL